MSDFSEMRLVDDLYWPGISTIFDVNLILSASSVRGFTQDPNGSTNDYTSQNDSNLSLVNDPNNDQFVLTDESTGQVFVFHDFNTTPTGRLKEITTRQNREQNVDGTVFSYDGSGTLVSVTLPEGQDYYVEFKYESQASSLHVSRILVWKTVSKNDQLMEVEYTYHGDTLSGSRTISDYTGELR